MFVFLHFCFDDVSKCFFSIFVLMMFVNICFDDVYKCLFPTRLNLPPRPNFLCQCAVAPPAFQCFIKITIIVIIVIIVSLLNHHRKFTWNLHDSKFTQINLHDPKVLTNIFRFYSNEYFENQRPRNPCTFGLLNGGQKWTTR